MTRASRKPLVMALEPRIMFDAAAPVDAAHMLMSDTSDPGEALTAPAPPAAGQRHEVAVI